METHTKSVEKDFPFQKNEWLVLRLGWLLMAVFLILGLIGVFGSGAVSWKSVNNQVATIEYERFLRNSMISEIRVFSKARLPDSSIYINADYLNKVQLDKINPEPASMEVKNGRLRLKFDSDQAAPVVLYIVPIETGSQNLEIEINGKREKINQFIHF